jgi:hypothetical protein
VARTKDEPIFALSPQFEQDLDLNLAAAEAGVMPDAFRQRVFASPKLASDLSGLNVAGGTVQRSVFVATFLQIVAQVVQRAVFVRAYRDRRGDRGSLDPRQ